MVEVNGIWLGTTPCEIKLRRARRTEYHVVVSPPPDATEELHAQSKLIDPKIAPRGGKLFFDLRVDHAAPVRAVEVRSP